MKYDFKYKILMYININYLGGYYMNIFKRLIAFMAFVVILPINYANALPPLAAGSDWLRDWSGTTLVLTSHTGPTTDAAKALSKEFEKITGATVEVIDESWTDLLAKHQADYAAGNGSYDVVTWAYLWAGNYIEGGLVDDMTSYMNSELVDPNYDTADVNQDGGLAVLDIVVLVGIILTDG